MNRRLFLAIALLLPLLALGVKTAWHYQQRMNGVEIRLPITGFDPRDLLAGHYLIYQVNYSLMDICHVDANNQTRSEICLEPRDTEVGEHCMLKLKGHCENHEFITGIERFYIPEQHAQLLEKAILNQQGEIVVNMKNDQAHIKTLLIDGKPWLDFIHASSH